MLWRGLCGDYYRIVKTANKDVTYTRPETHKLYNTNGRILDLQSSYGLGPAVWGWKSLAECRDSVWYPARGIKRVKTEVRSGAPTGWPVSAICRQTVQLPLLCTVLFDYTICAHGGIVNSKMFSGVLTDTAALFDTNIGTVALTFPPSFLLCSDAILRVFLVLCELHCVQNNYFSEYGCP